MEDFPKLFKLVENPSTIPGYLLADITCAKFFMESGFYYAVATGQFVKDPTKTPGTFMQGNIVTFDIFKPSEIIKKFTFNIRALDFWNGRGEGVEEAMPYSPYMAGSAFAICERGQYFDKDPISNYPPTIVIPDLWVTDICSYLAKRVGGIASGNGNSTALTLASLSTPTALLFYAHNLAVSNPFCGKS